VATRPTCPSPWKQEVRSRPISAARVDRDSTIKDRGRADMVSDCANTRSRTWTTNRPTPCVSRTKAQFRADSVGNRGKFFLGVSLVGAHAPTPKEYKNARSLSGTQLPARVHGKEGEDRSRTERGQQHDGVHVGQRHLSGQSGGRGQARSETELQGAQQRRSGTGNPRRLPVQRKGGGVGRDQTGED